MRSVCLAALLLALPPAVHAQPQQTSAGAQKFLESALSGAQIRFYYASGSFQDGKLAGAVTSPRECATSIEGIDLPADNELGANFISGKVIAWDRIAGVSVSSADITVKRLGSQEYYKFTFPTSEYAARVGYAMEFLRIACDKAAATGF
jgi:hypothetical protein